MWLLISNLVDMKFAIRILPKYYGLRYYGKLILIADDDLVGLTFHCNIRRLSSVRQCAYHHAGAVGDGGGEQGGMGECYFSGPRSLDKVG